MSNKKKSKQLGMPHGTATHRLRKQIMFKLVQQCGLDTCHRCGKLIENVDNFSIEHIKPWLDSPDPIGLFFDSDNITFSHQACNYAAARKPTKKGCPSRASYMRGCRCEGCCEALREYSRGEWHRNGKHARSKRQI